ncbi:GDSL-type esterase/lipase family protein [uncultured Flavonifractor sp.]|uniref:GDSL-type esterase/lipase family protein n=1 Tax=uncultured Flavonifractor sp. TaxID=1193534 RepID=UPI00266EA367|nr:GDSL-type esterase/lipase family protein [uncultured Flavonifractor sp.]
MKNKRNGPGATLPLLIAAAAVCVCLLLIPSAGKSAPPAAEVSPSVQPEVTPSAPLTEPSAAPSESPAVEPTPTATPVPSPAAVFDFTQPVPQSEPVEMDYFSDALFIGDSRTDGLQIYSGIKGATFYCYKGLNIFDMSKRQVVEMNGGKYTVVEALEKGPQYKKIYISLGVNELGYPGTDSFYKAFKSFLEEVKSAQPDAIIYLQNLVPVNPEICTQKKQPSYVNNDRVADFNGVFPKLAEECQVALVDVKTALSDENGILPAEATVDGVHFTKAWYQKWLEYLMCHTVTPEAYQAGQTAAQ